MMNEEIILQAIKELFDSVEELHNEYKDDNASYTIDVKKENNTMNITISLKENKDKKEFEKFVDELDDDLYQEVIDNLKLEIKDLNDMYETEDYKYVIDSFKEKVKEIAQNKINYLKTLI
jgi:hypothetical protein